MKLLPVDRVTGLTRERFKDEYLKPRRPVIFTDLIDPWPAKNKWTWDYLIENFGDVIVPVADANFSKAGKHYLSPSAHMKFGDYLKTIREKPVDLRIFLYNILKNIPELAKDIKPFEIMDGFLDEYPFMFFGGQGSYTRIHYDIDCSHVFLTQFMTRKRVLLFEPGQAKYLHHLPFTVSCEIDLIDPDEEKFPSLQYLEGYEAMLTHGETLFIPSCWWHHIEYTDAGYSLALRASDSIALRARGAFNIARTFIVDKGMNKLLGPRWANMKVALARANSQA
ncbi:MAG: cupin-like domain-containing protein [Saprospiraceae bacterium]|nr:cupin-like domain-containing protein [Saprospiraceae bacterium]HMW38355.1 cupin-like domain-containing protein [Saprospiraceae bacterium]HMX87898.1 cupin-like domain-containing protein [Saprospiraceae bacterium]HMZ39746.1 cupin-like domain-containing protein [Saprospiraceae bacterium]HNA63382.1 cupin-like domain-containing protein [Saprospiraceae bacterium]